MQGTPFKVCTFEATLGMAGTAYVADPLVLAACGRRHCRLENDMHLDRFSHLRGDAKLSAGECTSCVGRQKHYPSVTDKTELRRDSSGYSSSHCRVLDGSQLVQGQPTKSPAV